jgi:DNA-binding transcriptional ArsR family regulator
MASAVRAESALGERLARLTGEEASCCLPEYTSIASSIRRSREFALSLRRLKALSDENRLLAVALLRRRGELCACEIQAASGLSHATISHHMAVLVDAGLVEARRRGKWAYYRLTDDASQVLP